MIRNDLKRTITHALDEMKIEQGEAFSFDKVAMAYGRECCLQGYKTYFLKATELNQRFSEAIKYGREGSVVNGLVKPSCLIIDEIGRCVFNKENTRLFFDMVNRRYSSKDQTLWSSQAI